MGLFDRLFKNTKKKEDNTDPRVDQRLETILMEYNKNQSTELYAKIANELMSGEYNLFIPTVNEGANQGQWKTISEGATLKLKSVFNLDGLKVLGAFSTEQNLNKWIKEKSDYTVMNSRDVLSFCQSNGIDRIVIDSKMPSMFVIERNRKNIESETVKKETKVSLATPAQPIQGEFLTSLIKNFEECELNRRGVSIHHDKERRACACHWL